MCAWRREDLVCNDGFAEVIRVAPFFQYRMENRLGIVRVRRTVDEYRFLAYGNWISLLEGEDCNKTTGFFFFFKTVLEKSKACEVAMCIFFSAKLLILRHISSKTILFDRLYSKEEACLVRERPLLRCTRMHQSRMSKLKVTIVSWTRAIRLNSSIYLNILRHKFLIYCVISIPSVTQFSFVTSLFAIIIIIIIVVLSS